MDDPWQPIGDIFAGVFPKKKYLNHYYRTTMLVALLQSLVIPYNVFQAPRLCENLVDLYELENRAWHNSPVATMARRFMSDNQVFFPLMTNLVERPVTPDAVNADRLSLEEAELIDVLWRHDIDTEKATYLTNNHSSGGRSSIDTQIERDTIALAEKHLLPWNTDDDFVAQMSPKIKQTMDELLIACDEYNDLWQSKDIFGAQADPTDSGFDDESRYSTPFAPQSRAQTDTQALVAADDDILKNFFYPNEGTSHEWVEKYLNNIEENDQQNHMNNLELTQEITNADNAIDNYQRTLNWIQRSAHSTKKDAKCANACINISEDFEACDDDITNDVMMSYGNPMASQQMTNSEELMFAGEQPSTSYDRCVFQRTQQSRVESKCGARDNKNETRSFRVQPTVNVLPTVDKIELDDQDDFDDDISVQISSQRFIYREEQQSRRGRHSYDEPLARAAGLHHTAEQIATMSQHQFKQLLDGDFYNQDQLDVVRQIRRRGKNKIAARNCRARQSASINQLENENHILQRQLHSELRRQRQLKEELAREQEKLNRMNSH